MGLKEISQQIYAGDNINKKKQMDEIYYKMADFVKEYNKEWYNKFKEEAEDIAYEISTEKAKEIVGGMKPYGQHWSMEEVKSYLKTRGISEKIKSYYMVMNMMYNDYSRTAKQHDLDTPDFYFDLAFDFINDVDGKKHKVEKYFMK